MTETKEYQSAAEREAPAVEPEIVEAGRRAFAKHGYRDATVERIAHEAGLSRVTLHRRGISKEAILAALQERGVERYRSALWPALTGEGSGAARMQMALEALCTAAEGNLELLLALRSQTDAIFHESGEQALTRDVFTEPLERLLRDGAQDGSLRAVDPIEVATVLFNLVGWTYVHLRANHGWPPERAAGPVIELALNGLLAAPVSR